MSLTLFDLADFKETRVQWVPLYKPFGLTLLSVVVGDRCRDCGATQGTTQGSRSGIGVFMLCDACSDLDECATRPHSRGIEWHVSYWGGAHPAAEHDALTNARDERRDRWRRRQRKDVT